MLQTLVFPAGGRQIDAKANYFRYESCSAFGADESVRVRADGNDLGTYLPGEYVDLPIMATRWEVIPATPTATGVVRVGTGRVGSSRLTGNVRVIDSGADKTAAGAQFFGSIGKTPSVGTNFAIAAILAGAGKTVYVKRLAVSASAAGQVSIGLGSAAPALLPVALGNFANKLQSGAVSVATRATGECAAFFPTGAEVPGATVLAFTLVAANAFLELPLTTPIALPAGRCLFAVSPAANTTVNMIVDMEEA